VGRLKWIAAVGAALWVARWAALELAALAGSRWLPPGPAPKDSPRRPGLMPGPFER
jgi:hypothetical protein